MIGAIDYWCNAFFSDREAKWREAIEKQDLSIKVYREGDEFCSPVEMIRRMDSAGFGTLVLVASDPPPPDTDDPNLFEHVAARSTEMSELVSDYPQRFRGVWSVDPTIGSEGVERAAAMLEQPWCIGLHNHTHSWDRRFDHPDFEPFYALCAKHDVPFVMQAGASGGNFRHEFGRPEAIERPAADHPNVKFLLSHTGWPWVAETIDCVSRHNNVYLGTATWPLRRWPDELLDFATGAGRHKVLYGSGFPTTGHNQAARQFADPQLTARLDPELIELITRDNALTVFNRLPDLRREH